MTQYRRNKFSILKDLHLDNRVVQNNERLSAIFDNAINYSTVNIRIDAMKKKSVQFIKEAIQ